MGLAEMQAFAEQALKIDYLERKLDRANATLESTLESTVSKRDIKTWINRLSDDYIYITEEGKEAFRKILGDINE